MPKSFNIVTTEKAKGAKNTKKFHMLKAKMPITEKAKISKKPNAQNAKKIAFVKGQKCQGLKRLNVFLRLSVVMLSVAVLTVIAPSLC
jgi:hypothetical protein